MASPTSPISPGGSSAPGASWATRRAEALTAEAERLARGGAHDDALVRLREALTMDATFGPAYLALARSREALGDLQEAERALSMAVERVPGLTEARAERSRLRARRGDRWGAAADLEGALDDLPGDLDLHERVVRAWIAAGQLPRALAAARRMHAAAEAADDPAAAQRSRVLALALLRIVEPADPVADGEGRGEVRRLLAALARRGRVSSSAR